MNHQKATIVLRRAMAHRDLLSFMAPPLLATVAPRRERPLYLCRWREVRDEREMRRSAGAEPHARPQQSIRSV